MTDRRRPGEFEFIADYLAPLARAHAGALDLRDDAALLTGPQSGAEEDASTGVVVTTDTMVAGVHYPVATPPERVARKLLRVNLSDIAAMAATPFAYNLSLALSDAVDEPWLRGFVDGLAAEQAAWGVSLVGGDTVRTTGPVVATVSMFGRAPPGGVLRRSGARAGDAIFVSGYIGDAGLGLRLALEELAVAGAADRAYFRDRLELPTPRVALGARLAGLATAGIDVSDGLIADLGHLCESATPPLGARIQLSAVPVSAAAARRLGAPDRAVHRADLIAGGDDYELLFAVSPARARAVLEAAAALDVPVTRIGAVEKIPGVRVVDDDGREVAIATGGYRHF